MRTTLITGGAGFVGSHLVDACLERRWRVVVFDNFSKGRREYLPATDLLSIVEGDILSTDVLRATIEAFVPDVVFHLAAIHYIPECEQKPTHALRVNVEGTQHLLDACPGAHVVFASTGAIYDPDVTSALDEESRVRTGDIYGITKQTCEELIHYRTEKGLGSATVARLFNVVGPRETNFHLIPAIMEQLLRGVRRIELGNLFPRRDYVHVRDVADALMTLADAPQEGGVETFNIGSGVDYSVTEVIAMCAEIIGEPVAVESIASLRRKYDRPNQLANISRIRSRRGWSPMRNLKQALGEAWEEASRPRA